MAITQVDRSLCVVAHGYNADSRPDFGIGLGTRVELDDDEGERIGSLIRDALAQEQSSRSRNKL